MTESSRDRIMQIQGLTTRVNRLGKGHPAPYPLALAERLIKMFSFAGDTVLDPFAGTGTTAMAALGARRNSISVEIEPKYVAMVRDRLREASWLRPQAGAIRTHVLLE